MLCVDGVALAPHRQVDVHELGVDFYVSPKQRAHLCKKRALNR